MNPTMTLHTWDELYRMLARELAERGGKDMLDLLPAPDRPIRRGRANFPDGYTLYWWRVRENGRCAYKVVKALSRFRSGGYGRWRQFISTPPRNEPLSILRHVCAHVDPERAHLVGMRLARLTQAKLRTLGLAWRFPSKLHLVKVYGDPHRPYVAYLRGSYTGDVRLLVALPVELGDEIIQDWELEQYVGEEYAFQIRKGAPIDRDTMVNDVLAIRLDNVLGDGLDIAVETVTF